ncbi:uncharacterized protein SRS1_15295 [Sporisorium reilianum f. sp. reilianum]|uniref:SUN domain-containing protein n=1 Tax=Sporisorium reilianum f. sp. reilianum TaxID=72559 RepID=A0A2N8UIV0_9BASI|nr:uncharacterized protein SRS1_15295 [Sporisorium reilianum f. sp. reilianum]
MRPSWFWPAVILVSAQLIKPCYTLLDSGASPDAEGSTTGTAEQAGHARVASPQTASAGSLVVQDTAQLSVRPGCRRSTDFFDQVCSIPSKGSTSGDHDSPSLLSPAVTADLLVCDLPEVEPLIRPDLRGQAAEKGPSATYAVSGTIVVHEDGSKLHSNGDRLPELGGSSLPRDATADARDAVTDPATSQPDASYPGPDDEGFWRQRDGQHEWHPASKQGGDQSQPTRDAKPHDAQPNQAENWLPRHQDPSGLSEYDAWSAEQEQGAFLSFNEWKERHAQDHSGHARGSSSNSARSAAQGKTTQARSASVDSSAPPQQTTGHSDAPLSKDDAAQHQGSISQTTRAGAANTPSTSSTPPAPSPGQTESTQASEHAVPAESRPPIEVADPPSRSISEPVKTGFSVAAGDTGSQLSKLKHRWNFASLDCAAVVHRTNPEAKFASSILSEKKDRYMLSPCPHPGGKLKGGSQFVIVELCEEIKIDTVVLANYEFFSNMFKKFTVTAARQLTGRENDWTQLGTFRARNVRGQQVFRIPSAPRSEAFFRYVRIDFLEHFGSEYYCPVSLLRVYGITEMEEYKREFEEHDAELDPAAEVGESEQESVQATLPAPAESAPPEVPMVRDASSNLDNANLTTQDEDIWRKHEQAFQRKLQNQSLTDEAAEIDMRDPMVSHSDNASAHTPATQLEQPAKSASSPRQPPIHEAVREYDVAQCVWEDDPTIKARFGDVCIRPRGEAKPFHHLSSLSRRRAETKTIAADTASATRSNPASSSIAAKSRPASAAGDTAENDTDRGRRSQRPSGAVTSQQGNPGSESVYRAIHRRLNALESNATLSHSYIEHSGQMLREVFARMEKRQEARMSDMLRALNASNWHQIESLKRRQHVDLQRAIFEFDVHRQQADNERRALLREVQLLAEEVLLEKRLSIAQLVMLLVVFVFVGMTRGSRAVPLFHTGFTKIGRSSKRREAKSDGQAVAPSSPSRASARIQSNSEAKQSNISLSRESEPTQPRTDARHETITGSGVLPQQSRSIVESTTPAAKVKPLPFGSTLPENTANSKAAGQSHQRNISKTLANGVAGRAIPRGETLTGMLSHPRNRGRLILFLETLDALDRAADRRRLPKSLTRQRPDARRSKVGDKVIDADGPLRPRTEPNVLLPSDVHGRIARSHRPLLTHKQEHGLTNGRRHATPGRDRKAETFGFDDVAGMSSDWTERSENGDASENAAYLSEDEDTAIHAAKSDLISLEPVEDLRINVLAERPDGTRTHHEPSHGHPATAAADSLPPALTAERLVATSEPDKHLALPDLPSIARADGHLSSSDSESEGGAWHRVLPRRIGNSNSLRRARQGTIDGKSYKVDSETKLSTKPEASDRRGSPRPSSAQGTGFKSQKPALSRLFRTGTPEVGGPTSPQNRRSGTPDTLRDVRPA